MPRPSTLNYEVNLPAGTGTITITPSATSDAFIWIRGVNVLTGTAAAPISLSPGITTIPILVTSPDLTVTTPNQVRVTLDSVPSSTSITRSAVGTTSGLVFTTQPQVTIVDSASQVVLLGSYTVRARITSGAGGSLIGTTSAEKVPMLPAEVVKLARLAFADGARTTRTRYVFTAPLAAVT